MTKVKCFISNPLIAQSTKSGAAAGMGCWERRICLRPSTQSSASARRQPRGAGPACKAGPLEQRRRGPCPGRRVSSALPAAAYLPSRRPAGHRADFAAARGALRRRLPARGSWESRARRLRRPHPRPVATNRHLRRSARPGLSAPAAATPARPAPPGRAVDVTSPPLSS